MQKVVVLTSFTVLVEYNIYFHEHQINFYHHLFSKRTTYHTRNCIYQYL